MRFVFWMLASSFLNVEGKIPVDINGLDTQGVREQDFDRSPMAASVQHQTLGTTAVLAPISSCLSEVILVIFVSYLGMLDELSLFRELYGQYFADIEFYIDGTWCNPYEMENIALPCTGESLNRSTIPHQVHVIDNMGGGWLMQKALIDAVGRHRTGNNINGIFFITDDLVLNMGQLSRAAKTSNCNAIMRSRPQYWGDVLDHQYIHKYNKYWKSYLDGAICFFESSGTDFRAHMTLNLGSPSKLVIGNQNDFVYLPSWVFSRWITVAQQMTRCGLGFQYPMNAALFGVADMKDMLVMNTVRLRRLRPGEVLANSTFRANAIPPCWQGSDQASGGVPLARWVAFLLQQHVIHPVKLSKPTGMSFAKSINPHDLALSGGNDSVGIPFWCEKGA